MTTSNTNPGSSNNPGSPNNPSTSNNPGSSFYITTPIYYANAELHLGHAFTTLAADIASRFQRSMGRNTFFLTGSDEHGQKVEQAARAGGISPQEHVDRLVTRFKALWHKLHITHDYFVRTTDQQHKDSVRYILQKLWEKGDIYQDTYSGWYCTPCERFWTEKEVPEKICPDCQRSVEEIEEKNYFFRMSAYQNRLIEHIQQNQGFIRPENRKNEVLGFLAQPLGDLCVSRPKKRLSWGVELPFDADYVTYVWFDALSNYISALGYPHEMNKFNSFWPADFHLIGKDILTTHAVYWSTMLMALELPLPRALFAHGWWIIGGGKMSKSVGNVINPLDIIDQYGLEPFRFYLFREMVFGADANFTEESFILRYNADLANDYGNLCQRILPLLLKHRQGCFHAAPPELASTREVIALAQTVKPAYITAMEGLLFHEALKHTWDLVQRLNKYVDETAPWKLAKEGNTSLLDEVFQTVGEGIRFVSHLVHPFMPETSALFLRQIGLPGDFQPLSDLTWSPLPAGTTCTSQPTPVFPRLDTPRIEALKQAGKKAPAGEPEKAAVEPPVPAATPDNFIDFDDFCKVELAVAVVETAERVAKADKLLRLEVALGDEKRQLVAGIAEYYTPEEMVGKQVVMVKNLKPAKIRGVESQGMLLAVTADGGGLALIQPDKQAVSGQRVK